MKLNIVSKIPTLVARPSGVWDTRAPLLRYIYQHRSECRIFFGLLLGIERLVSEAHKSDPTSSARKFLRAKTGSFKARNAWLSFKRSYGQTPDGTYPHPTVKQLEYELKRGVTAIVEHAITSYSGMFETYVQCWALNYLLSKLESRSGWTKDEKMLAVNLSPLRGKRPLHGFPQIRDAIPELCSGLANIPHIAIDLKTNEEVTIPVTYNLNALRIIEFWRDYRNLLVHSSGLVSSSFYDRHYELVDELRDGFPYMPKLIQGKPLKLTDSSFRSMVSTHYVAARWMNELICLHSSGRRGHALAPKPKVENEILEYPRFGNPLIMEEDDPNSVLWITNDAFRERMLKIVVK